MAWYKTKKGILQRMWKNEKSVRSLDRAIKRGEVIEHNWMWGYKLDILSETVNMLEAEVKGLKKSEFQWWDLEEALANVEYYKRLYDEECEDKDKRIFKAFQWIKQKIKWADWDEFHDWIMSDEE